MKTITATKSRSLKESFTSNSSIVTPQLYRIRKSFSWNEFLHKIVSYLDSEIYRCVSLVSRSWCSVYDSRGSVTSGDAISRLLGAEMAHRMSSYWSTERSLANITERRSDHSHKWIDVCDYLMGYLHSYVPQGSQTSTTMALAIASEFIMSAPTAAPSLEFQRQVNELKLSSYLLSFTAMAIAIKIEVKYFKWGIRC